MPEQMMCPIRSDAKTVRHCQPYRCMWGRYYDYESGTRVWICSATTDDDFFNNEVETKITRKGDK